MQEAGQKAQLEHAAALRQYQQQRQQAAASAAAADGGKRTPPDGRTSPGSCGGRCVYVFERLCTRAFCVCVWAPVRGGGKGMLPHIPVVRFLFLGVSQVVDPAPARPEAAPGGGGATPPNVLSPK